MREANGFLVRAGYQKKERSLRNLQVKKGTEGKNLSQLETHGAIKMQHLKADEVHQPGTAHKERYSLVYCGGIAKRKRIQQSTQQSSFLRTSTEKERQGCKNPAGKLCCKWEGKPARWEDSCLWIHQVYRLKESTHIIQQRRTWISQGKALGLNFPNRVSVKMNFFLCSTNRKRREKNVAIGILEIHAHMTL